MANDVSHFSRFKKGRYNDGNWYCDHGDLRKEFPSRKNNLHSGEIVWRCAKKIPKERCSFFLWQVHEAEAKAFHKIDVVSVGQPPTTASKGIRAFYPMTPSPSTHRKRNATEITNGDMNKVTPDQNIAGEGPMADDVVRPIPFTPGQRQTKKVRRDEMSLATPESWISPVRRAPQQELSRSLSTSPTPIRSQNVCLEPDLVFPAIRDHIARTYNISFNASGEGMLRHLITSPEHRAAE